MCLLLFLIQLHYFIYRFIQLKSTHTFVYHTSTLKYKISQYPPTFQCMFGLPFAKWKNMLVTPNLLLPFFYDVWFSNLGLGRSKILLLLRLPKLIEFFNYCFYHTTLKNEPLFILIKKLKDILVTTHSKGSLNDTIQTTFILPKLLLTIKYLNINQLLQTHF